MSSEIENECRLSYFKVIGTVNEKHNVYYVQNVEDRKIYVKKTLSVYNKDVYEYIKSTGSAFYPKIYECVEKDNHLIVIEEYINGDTLEEIIRKRGMLSEKETGDIAIRLCRALSLLHSHVPAFIHRDIKPSNIMITNDNIMKIAVKIRFFLEQKIMRHRNSSVLDSRIKEQIYMHWVCLLMYALPDNCQKISCARHTDSGRL